MAMLAADRAVLSLLGGESVLYSPEVGDAVPIDGMFDERYVLAKGDGEAGVETTGPALFVRIDDLPADIEDDEPIFTIRGDDFRVTERRPDGIGGVVLVLRRVS